MYTIFRGVPGSEGGGGSSRSPPTKGLRCLNPKVKNEPFVTIQISKLFSMRKLEFKYILYLLGTGTLTQNKVSVRL